MPEPVGERMARRAAAAAAARPAFLAWVIARFKEVERLDEVGVARWLGTDSDQLSWLRLCRRPRPESFAADVDVIVERVGADRLRLAAMIRQVDSLSALTNVPTQESGVLTAARDREDDRRAGLDEDVP